MQQNGLVRMMMKNWVFTESQILLYRLVGARTITLFLCQSKEWAKLPSEYQNYFLQLQLREAELECSQNMMPKTLLNLELQNKGIEMRPLHKIMNKAFEVAQQHLKMSPKDPDVLKILYLGCNHESNFGRGLTRQNQHMHKSPFAQIHNMDAYDASLSFSNLLKSSS